MKKGESCGKTGGFPGRGNHRTHRRGDGGAGLRTLGDRAVVPARSGGPASRRTTGGQMAALP